MSQDRNPALEEVIGPVADVILAIAPNPEITREEVMDMLYHPYMKGALTMSLSVLDCAADMIRNEFTGNVAREIERRVRTFIVSGEGSQ